MNLVKHPMNLDWKITQDDLVGIGECRFIRAEQNPFLCSHPEAGPPDSCNLNAQSDEDQIAQAEWDSINKSAPPSDTIREIARYLLETGQATT